MATSAPLTLFSIDGAAAVPPFRQVQQQVTSGIAAGTLPPGTRLPAIRALATHLDLAVNTVAAAYRGLEEAGVLEGRGRAGTFVSLGTDPLRTAALGLARDALTDIIALGYDDAAAAEIFAEVLGASRSGILSETEAPSDGLPKLIPRQL